MFESLSEKLDSAFKKLRGHGRLTEGNIDEGLKEVRMALLEADVHYRVVKGFIEEVRSRSLGQEVMGSLTPGQQVVKIVYEKLTELMGSRHEGLNLGGAPPAAIMLVGLQGSGKTTTAGKLAIQLRKSGRRPFFRSRTASLPAVVVLPEPCSPTSITDAGASPARFSSSWREPISSVSFSLTILTTC